MLAFDSTRSALRPWALCLALLAHIGCASTNRQATTVAEAQKELLSIQDTASANQTGSQAASLRRFEASGMSENPSRASGNVFQPVGFQRSVGLAQELDLPYDAARRSVGSNAVEPSEPSASDRLFSTDTDKEDENRSSADAQAGDSSSLQEPDDSEAGDSEAGDSEAGESPESNLEGDVTSGLQQANAAIADDLPTRLPVAEYVGIVLATHPKIAAAHHRLAAAQNRIPQARSLSDPMLSETFWPFNGNALETAGGRAANQLAISQSVPWPEKLAAREAIACREAQIIEAEVRRIRLEIAESVEIACYEIWFASRALQVIEESDQLVQDLIEISEARYRTGGSQQDILRAQLELDRLAERRSQLIQAKSIAQADLATLMQSPLEYATGNMGLDVIFDVADLASVEDLDLLVAQAERTNPELRGLQAQIARDRAKQRLAGLQQYPDFQVGMNWLMVSDRDALSPVANGNDNFGFTVGMTLPVWREKIAAGMRESSHTTSSTASLLQYERDSVAGKLRRLLAQVESLVEQEQIYTERIIPRTEDMLKVALVDYRGNKADFFSVIATFRELLQLEIQRARLQATRANANARIKGMLGTQIYSVSN